MDHSILLVLAALPLLLTLYLLKQTKLHNKLQAPGPPGLPIIGNLLQFETINTHIYLRSLSRKYGPIMSMKLGYRPVLVISSPSVIQEIMKSHDLAFSSRPVLKGQQKLSYNGLDVGFSPYNDSWREMRKIATLHLFSNKQVQSFRPIREDEVKRIIEKISTDISTDKFTNLSELSISLTSNLICRAAFGKNYGDEGYQKAKFFDLLREAQAMMVAFYFADYFSSLGWIDKITGMDSRLDKIYKDLDSFYNELIEEHLDPNRPESMHGDILDLLLELRRDKSTPTEVSIEHIKGLIMNVFAGATDTSAAAIVWAMTALMNYPSMLKKVQDEIRTTIGKKQFLDEDDTAKLPYLRALIKETFRLYPSTPLLALRETWQKCTVSGYEIKPGTTVYINAWAVGRDPEVWKNPEEFMPERFMESNIDVRGFNPEVIPFGIGRRKCPGVALAMPTVELALANILYAFDWELPAGMKKEDIDYQVLPGVTMHKKIELCLVAKPVNG